MPSFLIFRSRGDLWSPAGAHIGAPLRHNHWCRAKSHNREGAEALPYDGCGVMSSSPRQSPVYSPSIVLSCQQMLYLI